MENYPNNNDNKANNNISNNNMKNEQVKEIKQFQRKSKIHEQLGYKLNSQNQNNFLIKNQRRIMNMILMMKMKYLHLIMILEKKYIAIMSS